MSNPLLEIGGIKVWLYLLENSAYPSHLYLLKNFKTSVTDPKFNDYFFYDFVNSKKVVIDMHLEPLRIHGKFLRTSI